MHGVFLRNLKRATRVALRQKRHQNAAAGYEPKVYTKGRRARQEKPREDWVELLLWTWPALLLIVIASFSDPDAWIKPVFGWFIVSACAAALRIAKPISQPRRGLSYVILVVNLGAIVLAYFGAEIGG